ncbi:MAG TPA: hypothetical protein VKU90_10350 [Caulobacteraceae bacterium]|nr:hypothetical protein [Caulobacteraceae bacterium]
MTQINAVSAQRPTVLIIKAPKARTSQMTIVETVDKPHAAMPQDQVANSPKEPFGRPVVSFDASLGRRTTRSGARGGLAKMFHTLFAGRNS